MMKPFLLFFLVSLAVLPIVLAAEAPDDDITVFDLELEKLLYLGGGILATILFILTFAAYRRTLNKRLCYVSLAFALFAVKGFLIAHELFFTEWAWVDPFASVFDFAILLIFFFGVIKS